MELLLNIYHSDEYIGIHFIFKPFMCKGGREREREIMPLEIMNKDKFYLTIKNLVILLILNLQLDQKAESEIEN